MEHSQSVLNNYFRHEEAKEREAERLRQELEERQRRAQERRESLKEAPRLDHFEAVKLNRELTEREKQESNATLNEEMFVKHNKALAQREDSIEAIKEHARNYNYDVEIVRQRREVDEKIEDAVSNAAKHELELKLEMAEALRADRLRAGAERRASLRHDVVE
ncbi:hypothetical protein HK103_001212 [Boothiomyces macroporosus]|uniref:Uncharacterized protein n=1 Tax=Boothiomyces macroporosus TaxID=261099 RepID=A0AAD5Y9Z8_9FUNG|nr:hypothetical protein HK103_001212 [Boothiomyces macroporosus]